MVGRRPKDPLKPPLKLVVLDRDGVINIDSDAYIKTPEEFSLIPGSGEAIARLNHAGWIVAVATNQSGIARGLFDYIGLSRIHAKMYRELAAVGARVDLTVFCPHGPQANCDCRKPGSGLLISISKRLRTSLTGVPMVGDSLRDIVAAQVVGARPILVLTGKGTQTLEQHREALRNVVLQRDLSAAVSCLLD